MRRRTTLGTTLTMWVVIVIAVLAASNSAHAAPTARVIAVSGSIADPQIETMSVQPEDAAATVAQLRRSGDYLSVELDAARYPTEQAAAPTDPWFVQQWGFPAIAWTPAYLAAPAATVADIDSGFDVTIADLKTSSGGSRFAATWNAVDGSTTVTDRTGHGTLVTSIIGASSDGAHGGVGVAPNAPLLGIKIADAAGNMYVSNEIKAIQWAVAHGARVINLSLGGPVSSTAEHAAVQAAVNAGVVVVAAAGNSGCERNPANYPAAYPETLAVGAIDQNEQVPCFSSHGSYVDVVGPGVDIIGPRVGGNGFVSGDGTSFAGPHVAGVLSLLAGAHPDWTATQLADTIRATARDIGPAGWDEYSGHGVVNAPAALAAVLPTPRPDDPENDGVVEPAAVPSAQSSVVPPARVTGPAVSGDVFEPNDNPRRARTFLTAMDLVRLRSTSLTATISRTTDPVDIYAVRIKQQRRLLRVAVTLRNRPAAVHLKVFTLASNGRLRLACDAKTKTVVLCPTARKSRVWVQVIATKGATRYSLKVR